MNTTRIKNQNIDNLFNAILSLKDINECYMFLCDLCTPNELNLLAQRFEIARGFHAGENFTTLNKKIDASTATISKVKKELVYGNGGFSLILDRLSKEVEE